MLKRRQFSLRYLLFIVTIAAVGAGFVRFAALNTRLVEHWLNVVPLTLIGGGLIAVSVGLALHATRVLLFWPRVQGTVVRYFVRSSDGQRFYHPVVRFKLGDGQCITAIGNTGLTWRPRRTGGRVTVRYSPRNPRWFEITSPSNLWGFGPALATVGFFLFVVATIGVGPRFFGR